MEKEVLDFYYEVLTREASAVECGDIELELENIRAAYRQTSRARQNVSVDYSEAGKRYAYIYFYAVCHTVAVTRLVMKMRNDFPSVFTNMMKYHEKVVNICCLGGGPGSDLIGLLRARAQTGIGFTKKIHCSVVDISTGWEKSLRNVLNTYLKSPSGSVYKGKLQFQLLWSDLQACLSLPVIIRVANADILNLVKFVSALPAGKIVSILKTIFSILKPGAFVLFLDNSTGGICKIVEDAANQAGLLSAIPRKRQYETISVETWCIGPVIFDIRPLKHTSICFSVWEKAT